MAKSLASLLAAILLTALACGAVFPDQLSLKSENSNGIKLVETQNFRFERVLAAALGYGKPIKVEGDAAILRARSPGRCRATRRRSCSHPPKSVGNVGRRPRRTLRCWIVCLVPSMLGIAAHNRVSGYPPIVL